MIKIKLSPLILKMHNMYVNDRVDRMNIDGKLTLDNKNARKKIKTKIEIKKEDLKAKVEHEYIPTVEEANKSHNEFLNYFRKNKIKFATGKPEELRKQIKFIEEEPSFKAFNFMIKNNIKVMREGSKNLKNYSSILVDILGFSDFSSISYNIVKDKTNIQEQYKDFIQSMKQDIKDKKSENKLNIYEIETLAKTLKYKMMIDTTDIKASSLEQLWSGYIFTFLIDITVCPYCNRQHIGPIHTKSGKMRGDLDHFFSKSKYPYLSISIYNLVPSCKFCNSSLKHKKEFDIEDLHPYEDNLDDNIKFGIGGISDNIKIKVKETNKINRNVKSYIDIFQYEQQYQYHKIHVMDLILKSRMYTNKNMKKIFDELCVSEDKAKKYKEALFGYKEDINDINNRPLAKLTRDIVFELNIESLDEKLKIDNETKIKLENIKKKLG